MQRTLLRLTFIACCVIVAVGLHSYSSGSFGTSDRTGRLGTNSTCQACHNSFSLNSGSGSIQMNLPASFYPGTTYNVSMNISQSSPSPVKHGFQAVSVRDNSSNGAGSFTSGTGTGTNTTGGRSYIKHNSTVNSSGTWNFTWTAPSFADTVTFYYAGIAANGANGNQNDYVYSNSSVLYPLQLITATTDSTAVSCFGENDGAASISNISGGAGGPYTYEWSTGDTTLSISNLTAGVYTVSVQDSAGNEQEINVTVDSPDEIQLQFQTLPSSCAFGSGEISVIASGGAGGFTYLWNDPSATTDSIIMNAGIGWFTVTVTDASGCTAIDSAEITQTGSGLVGAFTSSSENCDQADGSSTVVMIQGNAPYSYAWSNGGTTQTISGLAAGVYTVTVTDNLGCFDVFTDTINESNASINASVVVDNLCFGSENGSVSVPDVSGAGAISYSWSNGATTSSITDLEAGDYTLTITDSAGCTDVQTYTVSEPDSFYADVTIDSANQGFCDGIITLTTMGGTPPYTYDWSHQTGLNSSMADELCGGPYTITIEDSAGCLITLNVDMPEATGISNAWSKSINIFPNPASSEISLRGDRSTITSVSIVDLSGRTVSMWKNDIPASFDISELSVGQYSVLIRSNEGLVRRSLIIGR